MSQEDSESMPDKTGLVDEAVTPRTDNPWSVANLDEYLLYCCPQCDVKKKLKAELIQHAIGTHTESHEFLIKSDDDAKHFLNNWSSVKVEADVDILSQEKKCKSYSGDDDFIDDDEGEESEDSYDSYESEEDDEESAKNYDDNKLYIESEQNPDADFEPDYDDDDDDDYKTSFKVEPGYTRGSSRRQQREVAPGYQCYICGANKTTLDEVKSHQKDEHDTCNEQMFGDPRTDCPLCQQKFDYSDNKLHVCNVSVQELPNASVPRKADENQFMCYKCGAVEDSQRAIKAHQKSVHGSTYSFTYGKPRDYQCMTCKNMFESSAKLSVHMCRFYDQHKREGDGFACGKCGVMLKSELAYDAHMSTVHTQERRFKCNMCDYRAKTHLTLRNHVKQIHETIVTHVCEECGRSFKKATSLRAHIASFHNEKKDYICTKCGASFGTEEYLNKHCQRLHPTYLMCTLCDKLFTVGKKLRQHLFTEHQCTNSENVIVCPLCKKQCSSITELDEHNVNEHGMAKLVPCNRCTMFCSSLLVLKLHLLQTHVSTESESQRNSILHEVFNFVDPAAAKNEAKKNGFPCDICGKVLSRAGTLVEHRRQTHEKHTHDFKCQFCTYTTYQAYLLRRHIKSRHDKSRKYQCDICPSYFFVENDLKVHKKKVHEKFRRYKCQNCDSAYNDIKIFRIHMLKVHGSDCPK